MYKRGQAQGLESGNQENRRVRERGVRILAASERSEVGVGGLTARSRYKDVALRRDWRQYDLTAAKN